jgi:hypothetical protein
MKAIKVFLVTIFSSFVFINCSNEKAAWENTRLNDSTVAYEDFLTSFPDGEYADSARMEIQGRQFLIYTVPSNLNVYFSALDTNKTNLSYLEEGCIKIYNKDTDKHYLINNKYHKGRSPIAINDIISGRYLMGVEPVDFVTRNWVWQNEDPFLQKVAYVSSFSLEKPEMVEKFQLGEIEQNGAIIYMTEKEKGKKKIVIIHAKESLSLDELNTEYPKNFNFTYDSQTLIKALEEKHFLSLFTDDELKITQDLLRRGGKAIAEKGDISFLIEILNDSKFKVETFRRKKE